jgi:hypothetical protein
MELYVARSPASNRLLVRAANNPAPAAEDTVELQ